MTLYDLNMLVIKPATAKTRVSYVELVAEAGHCMVVRCPKGHVFMTKVGKRRQCGCGDINDVACNGCGVAGLTEHFQCVRCDYKYCESCAEKAKQNVARAELQAPEFFVSHWYALAFHMNIAALPLF